MSEPIFNSVIACAALLALALNAVAEIREDPLRPPGYRGTAGAAVKKPGAPSWRVNEILISDSRRVAIVNDNSVKKGDYVNGARVVDIKPDYVTLEYNNRLITARLSTLPVKRRVKAKAQ